MAWSYTCSSRDLDGGVPALLSRGDDLPGGSTMRWAKRTVLWLARSWGRGSLARDPSLLHADATEERLRGPLSRQDETAYITALLANLEGQKRYTLLYVTFAVGMIVLFLNAFVLSDKQQELLTSEKIVLTSSLFVLTTSAVFHYGWIVLLHRLSIEAVDLIITRNIAEARRIHYPGDAFLARWGWIVVVAKSTLVLGLITCMVLVWLRIW